VFEKIYRSEINRPWARDYTDQLFLTPILVMFTLSLLAI